MSKSLWNCLKTRLEKKYLVKNLNSLCLFLDKTYNVNSGGCCFLAFVIAKELDKRQIKYNLRILYNDQTKDGNAIIREVQNCYINSFYGNSTVGAGTCRHYYLHIVGGGSINGTKSDLTISKINHSNIEWIYSNGLWNKAYDIKYNSDIIKLVKIIFNKYDTEKSKKGRKTSECLFR